MQILFLPPRAGGADGGVGQGSLPSPRGTSSEHRRSINRCLQNFLPCFVNLLQSFLPALRGLLHQLTSLEGLLLLFLEPFPRLGVAAIPRACPTGFSGW